jgi:hypothetical protein
MIYIDFKKFRPSKRWQKKSKGHLSKLLRYHQFGKGHLIKRYIDKKQKFWGTIKNEIIKCTVNKCWFSEGTSDVSHFHIEHFRPKKEVTLLGSDFTHKDARKSNSDIGYWWLAFNYKNFRIAGPIANSYKGSFFPLEENSPVASSYSRRYLKETSLLLDPTVKDDVELLTFDITGMPTPVFDEAVDPWKHRRAAISIRVYGLLDDILLTARKDLTHDCERMITYIEKYDNLYQNDLTSTVYPEILYDLCFELKVLAKPEKRFSALVNVRINMIPQKRIRDLIKSIKV